MEQASTTALFGRLLLCCLLVVMWAAERLQVARVQPERIIQSLERDTMVDIVCCSDFVLL
jgi:hypothetical protein